MAQQQQNITIAAPGFGGVNTEVSPTQQGEAFAAIADNCVIDKYGRIGSRKGFTATTTDGSAFGGDHLIEQVYEHLAEDGVLTTFSCANNKIWKGELIPADVTPATTVTANHWSITTFNDDAYFVQKGHAGLQYDYSTDTLAVVAAIPQGDCVVGAYGRLWVSGVVGLESIVYWSNLLVGTDFSTGTSGSIDVAEYWPRGHDSVTAIAFHNNFLIVFGKHSILVYSGANGDPGANLTLVDSVNGVGCVARDSVAYLGADIFFLDESGVRSFARTVQEKSMPIGEVSKNVRTDILSYIAAEADASLINCVFSPEESFYLVQFRTSAVTACFSTKLLGQDGEARATFWTGQTSVTATYTPESRLLLGGTSQLGTYSGYSDDGVSYRMRYYSNPFSFGDSSILKFPKQVDFTIISGSGGTITIYWAFNYATTYRSKTLTLNAIGAPSEFNVAEYNVGTYTGGTTLDRIKANVGGSGVVVTIGIETDIAGEVVSIQEMNIQALLGRIL